MLVCRILRVETLLLMSGLRRTERRLKLSSSAQSKIQTAYGTYSISLFRRSRMPSSPRFDLFTRMLFSCLVDADRLDSAGRDASQAPLRAAERLSVLTAHLAKLSA